MFSALLPVKGEEFPRKLFMKWSEHEHLWFIGYANTSTPSNIALMNCNTVGYGETSLSAVKDLVRLMSKMDK